jgi:L-seryl-tRNA(Ser) seleniumtransferase
VKTATRHSPLAAGLKTGRYWCLLLQSSSVAEFRIIPSIEQLRQRPAIAEIERQHGADATLVALREAAAALRDAIRGASSAPDLPDDESSAAAWIEREASHRVAARFRGSLIPVINATGVVLHTNLGRAPLSEAALQRVHQVGRGYSTLEYDLDAGRRGSRHVHAEALLTRLTGAEAALVANNNAAATLLMLAALGAGREVVVSRGELVEIGGGFRIPDVMAQSGATLREVGTTNRTRVADYVASIGPRTALLLRVHPSNFRIEGFTERPTLEALVAAARDAGIPIVEDLGSGCLVDGLADEPTVQQSIAAGVDLVCFSGDKLLGGPQCGIIAGRRVLIDHLKRHPLMRALRVDKLTLAALEGTLLEYLAGRAPDAVPVVQMIQEPADSLETRARMLADELHGAGWTVALASGSSAVGGGSAPGIQLPTVLIAIEWPGLSADALESALRALDPPIVARIEHDRVVLDLRTVNARQEITLRESLIRFTVSTSG